MIRTFPRNTIEAEFTVEGPGLHSGGLTRVTVRPSTAGLVMNGVPVHPDHVTDTTRCTTLGEVRTVEHLMSALAGMQITDAEILVEGGELPAADGCALPYTQLIIPKLIGSISVEGPFARIFEKGDNHMVAIGLGEGHFQYDFITGERWPGKQSFDILIDSLGYQNEIAGARTIAFEEELPVIRQLGLGQGLNEDSALILGRASYVNHARFPDEPARHKLLDLMGDLYLSGVPIAALNVHAEKSGHTANVAAAVKLSQAVSLVRS